jgi:signal transduction histidine kinase
MLAEGSSPTAFEYWRGLVLALAPASLMLLVGALGYLAAAQRSASLDDVRHAHVVEAELHLLRAELRDVEAEQRAFLLAASDAALAAYNAAKQAYHRTHDTLKARIRDPGQAARLDSLGNRVDAWLQVLDANVKARVAHEKEVPEAIARGGRAAAIMADIESRLDVMAEAEAEILAHRAGVARGKYRVLLGVVVGGTLGAGILATLAALWYSRSLSALRRLNAAVSSVAQEWARTFDAIDLPIVVVGPDLRVRRLNAPAARLSERPVEVEAPARVEELGTTELWPAMSRAAAEVQASGQPRTTEVTLSPGGRRWELLASPAELWNVGSCAIIVARDLTPLLELQEALRAIDVTSAMGLVAGGVAHEVRNPLHAIIGIVAALEAKLGTDLTLRPFAEHLRQQVERVSHLMTDLLEYGRPSVPNLALSSLEECIVEALRRCEATAMSVGVRLVQDFACDLPRVALDRERIGRAIENLALNAIQHTPPGKLVTVSTALRHRYGQAYVECTVRDRGPGFLPEELADMFRPFKSRRAGGTGLGLPVAQRIAHEHGGTLSAANDSTGGAVLRLTLPVPA